MNKNMIIAGISALALIIVIILILVFPGKPEPEPEPVNNGKYNPDKTLITDEILRGIEDYITGDKSIVKVLNESDEHKKIFAEMLRSEPAFTLGLIKILTENREFEDLALNFASHFSSPELYPALVDYLKIRGIDEQKRLLAYRILASGEEKALEVIFEKHFDADTGRISDVGEIMKFVQFFPHYYQLKFWLEKYKGEIINDLLSKTAKINFNKTVVTYSQASMKTQLRLFADINNPEQQEVILWSLALNRIRPEWYSWFVPMFAKAVSEKDGEGTKVLFLGLIEVIRLPRRDLLVTLLENWMKKNPYKTRGYKILQGAVQQGRTSIERYRDSNSLRSNEFTKDGELPDPDEKLPARFKTHETKVDFVVYEKLVEIYTNDEVDESDVRKGWFEYNFEVFSKFREQNFLKPYLFEIAYDAGNLPEGDSWRNSFFSVLFLNKPLLKAQNVKAEEHLYQDFINVLGMLWGYKEFDTAVKADLFEVTQLLESAESQIAKFLHLAILELLALPANDADTKDFIERIGLMELTDNQKFSLTQILAVNLDRDFKAQSLSKFNPFQLCIDKGLLADYSDILKVLSFKRHKFSHKLLKSILMDSKDDEKLVLAVFNKIKGADLSDMVDEIAQFLNSQNPVLLAETLMMLPFNEKYLVEFERFMSHVDSQVKVAASVRILEAAEDNLVFEAISVLKHEKSDALGWNLWRIKKTSIILPLLLELSQTNVSVFADNIKLRSDLLLDDRIFDTALEVYEDTADIEVQAEVMSSMLTRDDKVPELLVTAGKNKNHRIRKIAWDFALNNSDIMNEELILILLDADYFKDVQNVLTFIANEPRWISENKDIKKRVLKFLEKSKEGLEFSAVSALINLDKDAEVSAAFCKAINKRVLWPVSVQVWFYIKSFKDIAVAEAMLDIISNEERNATDFASSYLVGVYNDFKGLPEKIYKAYEKLDQYKNIVDFLPVFTGTLDKNAAKTLVNNDYSKLKNAGFTDSKILPREVAQALSIIFALEADPQNMIKKAYWTKYIK